MENQQKNAEVAKQQAQNLEIGVMKPGDYMIHVFIESSKNLKPEDSQTINIQDQKQKKKSQSVFNALAMVQYQNKEIYSRVMSDILAEDENEQHWGEHFFFEPKNLSSDQIQSDQLKIVIFDKGMLKNRQVGQYEFDIAWIYYQNDQHALIHQWIALNNSSAVDSNSIKGFLKVSISIQGPGDQSVKLSEQSPYISTEQVSQEVLMPSTLKKEFKQINISVFQGQQFPKMDTFGVIDPYLIINRKNQILKTEVAKYQNDFCDFNQMFKVPVQYPISNDELIIKLMDQDQGSLQDDKVGSIHFSLNNILKTCSQQGGKYIWRNIFGSPIGLINNNIKEEMNLNPELASLWKGRVLFHIEVQDSKAPDQGVLDIKNSGYNYKNSYKNALRLKEYEIIAEIGAGICLPESKKYNVMIQIAEFQIQTEKPIETKVNYCRWSKRFENLIFKCPYQSLSELERVYIYLMDGNTPICFWKGNVNDFQDRNPKFKWISLIKDNYHDKVKHQYNAGMIQIKMSINNLEENPPANWKQYPTWKYPPPVRLEICYIRCFIFQCRGLGSGDDDGGSDPFIKIFNPDIESNQKKKNQSQVIYDNLNPIFYEAFEVDYFYQKNETPPPIVLDIFDFDNELLSIENDFLGRAIINLDQASIYDFRNIKDKLQMNKIPKPQWHNIRTFNNINMPVKGQILCSFVIAPYDFKFEKPVKDIDISKEVETKEFNIDIHILGLRQLQSFGIIPVRKPFIKFNTRSLLPPQKSYALSNIQTDPRDSGANPNINTTITFQIQLPTDSLYCPELACEVFDFICKGLTQPKIGTFSISIGKIMFDQVESRKQKIQNASEIIQQLQQILEKTQIDRKILVKKNILPNNSILDKVFLNQMKQKYIKQFGCEYEDDFSDLNIDNNQRNQRLLQYQQMRISKRKKAKTTDQIISNRVSRESLVGDQILERSKSPSSIMNDTILNREQTQTQLRDADYESTLIIKESDYGDLDDSFIADRNRVDKNISSPIMIGKVEKVLIDDNDDKQIENRKMLQQQLLFLLQNSRLQQDDNVGQMQQQDFKIVELFDQIEDQDSTLHANFIHLLKELRKKRQQFNIKNENQTQKQIHQKCLEIENRINHHLADRFEKIKAQRKRSLKHQIAEDLINNISKGIDVHRNLIWPKYVKDERLKIFREVDFPPETIYYAVGYDQPQNIHSQTQKQNKHYRKFYMDELENNTDIFRKQTFLKCPVYRGKSQGMDSSFFEGLFGNKFNQSNIALNKEQNEAGFFKGIVKIYNEKENEQYSQQKQKEFIEIEKLIRQIYQKKFQKNIDFDLKNLDTAEDKQKLKHVLVNIDAYSQNLMNFLQEECNDTILQNQIANPQECLVRLYLLEGFDLSSRDISTFSDPYVIVKCGQKSFNRREFYQLDEPNPKFFDTFEFNIKFPGAQPLEIEVYDYDDLFGDDLIGKTVIDLDDRQYSPDWKSIKNKPIEFRQIYHPSSTVAQGTILCWLDILSNKKKQVQEKYKLWDIKPEPIQDYQLRVSVYETKNVPMEDIEGTSDVFVKAWINQNDKKETDTHWRCTTGEASFNYRLIFDFKSPTYSKSEKDNYKLILQIFDRDVFKSNDFICQFEIDLRLIVQDCRMTRKQIHLSNKYYQSYFKDALKNQNYNDFSQNRTLQLEFEDEDSFWLSVHTAKSEKPIKIRLDIRVLPGADALSQKVGDARSEPNNSPYLPSPIGRMQLSLNPITILGQCVGQDIRSMIFKNLIIVIAIALCVFVLPTLISELISQAIVKMF